MRVRERERERETITLMRNNKISVCCKKCHRTKCDESKIKQVHKILSSIQFSSIQLRISNDNIIKRRNIKSGPMTVIRIVFVNVLKKEWRCSFLGMSVRTNRWVSRLHQHLQK